MSRIRSNRVLFTLNNYEETDITKITEIADNIEKYNVKYIVCGEEIGESGTRHLQGFINMDMDPKKGGIKYWKEFFNFSQAAHFENARGSDSQNKTYCTKDEIFIEGGIPQEKTESVFKRIFDTAKINVDEACEIDPEIGLRYYNQLKQINADYNKQVPKSNIETLREWQKKAMDLLDKQNERQILFVIDQEGGKGKSALARHLMLEKEAWACQGKHKGRSLRSLAKNILEFASGC